MLFLFWRRRTCLFTQFILILCLKLFFAKESVVIIPSKLQKAVERMRHNDVTNRLQFYVTVHEEWIEAMEAILNHYAEMDTSINVNEQLENPVTVLHFLDWQTSYRSFLDNKYNNALSQLDAIGDVEDFVIYLLPDYNVRESAKAILLVSEVHNLNPRDLANGDLLGRKSRPLTFDECFDLAMMQSDLIFADADKGLMLHIVEDWLSFVGASGSQSGNHKHAQIAYLRLFEMQRHMFKRRGCECSVQDRIAETTWKNNFPNIKAPPRASECNDREKFVCKKGLLSNSVMRQAYNTMCRGGDVSRFGARYQNSTHRGTVCRYNHHNDPRLFLAPAKEEEINNAEPFMVRVHDIVSEAEMEQLKLLAIPTLKEGTVFVDNRYQPNDNIRVCASEYITKEHHALPLVKQLRGRMEAVTELFINENTAEELFFANYGSGGFFYLHSDFKTNKTLEENDRIATVIIYFNDVDGGETVFPYINIKVEALKGTALIFQDKKRNCEHEHLSIHGGCPILTGEKTIITEWILRYGQEFKRPCELDRYK